MRFAPSLALVGALVACGGKKTAQVPPPPAPSTGAPVAFVVDKLTPGTGDARGALAVRAYNFSATRVAQYSIFIRYYDQGGAVVRIDPGTPFEKSYASWSFSGRDYVCGAKRWCDFTLDHLEIPKGAVRAEILAERVRALRDEVHFEDHDLFEMKDHEWPGASKEPVPWPAAFAGWGDAATAKAAWQGAWAGDGFGLGNTAAWQVDGDQVTFVDRKGEQHFTLSIDSPCEAGFGGGDNGGWENVYTLKDGELVTGLGDAGQRHGDQALVCGFGSVWLFDGHACTKWRSFAGRWESEPGTCGFKQDDGKEIFFYVGTSDGYESKLQIDGDTIWSEQLARTHAQKFPDLAAARAAQHL